MWESERPIVPLKPGNAGGGKGPCFWVLVEGTKGEEIGVSLATPFEVRQFPRKLYLKAKEERRHTVSTHGTRRLAVAGISGEPGVLKLTALRVANRRVPPGETSRRAECLSRARSVR